MIRFYNAICVLGLVLAGYGVKAQIIWQQNFEYGSTAGFPADWLSNGWRCDYDVYIQTACAPRTKNSTRVAGVSGYMVASRQLCEFMWKNQTDLLVQTPFIDLRGRNHPRLKFDSYFLRYRKNGHFERAAVQVTADSGATWTVLREVPPTVFGAYNICQVDLSRYTTAPGAIRIGLFYTDSTEYMPGWMVDNFEIFEPAGTDLALVGTNQSDTFRNFHQIPANVALSGSVVNFGTSPVTGFTAHWQDGTGTIQSTTVSGINLQPLDTYRVSHAQPVSLSAAGKRNLRMWVSLPGDLKPANDSLKLSVNGCTFFPQKRLVIEEGTGTWNIGAPRGDVYLHRLDTAAVPPIRISAHSEDVMEYRPYSDHLYALRQLFTHFIMFDRRDGVHHDAFFSRAHHEQNNFGFADIGMNLSYNAGILNLDVDVHPAVDLPGRYRVAMVLTEDNVRGTSKAFNQSNGFSRNRLGSMGGYENLPDTVLASDMRYDYVVRDASPGPEGRLGAIGVDPKAGQHYTATFVAPVGISWRKENLNVIAMLIRESDSTIVNANIRRFSTVSVPNVAQLTPEAYIFPNPANYSTQLALELIRPGRVSVSITDISGRLIGVPVDQSLASGPHQWTIPTTGLAAGMYLVRIVGPGFQESLKLSVAR